METPISLQLFDSAGGRMNGTEGLTDIGIIT